MYRVRYRLDELLKRYNLTAKEVASATGVREATLSLMRRGQTRRVPDDMIAALCVYFRRYQPAFGPGDLMVVEEAPPQGGGEETHG